MTKTITLSRFSENQIKQAWQPGAKLRKAGSKLYLICSRIEGSEVGQYYTRHYRKPLPEKWIPIGSFPELSPSQAVEAYNIRIVKLARQEKIGSEAGRLMQKINCLDDLLNWYLALEKGHGGKENTYNNRKWAVGAVSKICGELTVEQWKKTIFMSRFFQPAGCAYNISSIEQMVRVIAAAARRAMEVELIEDTWLATIRLSMFTHRRPKIKPCNLVFEDISGVAKEVNRRNVRDKLLSILVIATAARINEVAGLAWRELELNKDKPGKWRLPANKAKNGEAHIFALDPRIVNLLLYYRTRQRPGTRVVFPSRCNNQSISANWASKLVRTSTWSSHDFRKVARSWWQDHKVDYAIGEYLISHKLPMTQRIYIQTNSWHLVISAVVDWCDWIEMQGLSINH